jgi:hypothetical protein
MGSIAFALPVKPGAKAVGDKFIDDLTGGMADGHHQQNKEQGLTRVKVFRQHTPHEMVVVYLEGPDVGKAMESRAKSGHEFDDWFGKMVEEITGHHPSGHIEPAELLLDWHHEHGHSRTGHAV